MYVKCLILDIPELDPSKDMDPMADKVNLKVTAISLTSIQQSSKYVIDGSDEVCVVEDNNKNIFEILDDDVEEYITVFFQVD